MKLRRHPTFQTSLRRRIAVTVTVAIACFVVGFYFRQLGLVVIGWIFHVGFGVTVVLALAYSSYRLRNVACLECGGKTKTAQDSAQLLWVANCEHCKISWDLQTPIGD